MQAYFFFFLAFFFAIAKLNCIGMDWVAYKHSVAGATKMEQKGAFATKRGLLWGVLKNCRIVFKLIVAHKRQNGAAVAASALVHLIERNEKRVESPVAKLGGYLLVPNKHGFLVQKLQVSTH